LCPIANEYSGPLVTSFANTNESKPLVTSIRDSISREARLTGGKGSSLAFLTSLDSIHSPENVSNSLKISTTVMNSIFIKIYIYFQILVPQGIVLTTNAWANHLVNSANISSLLERLKKVLTSGNDNQIREACTM